MLKLGGKKGKEKEKAKQEVSLYHTELILVFVSTHFFEK